MRYGDWLDNFMTDETRSPHHGEKIDRLIVVISLDEARAEFSGSPEIVMQSINNFISKNIPEIDFSQRSSR